MWHRRLGRGTQRRRGPGRVGGGQLNRAELALLRPALESAVVVAATGERLEPRVPAPAPLRRFLGFAKLPTKALEAARRVLDEDDEFRARVRDAVELAGVDTVGEAGWLFLDRPPGWEDALAGTLGDADREDLARDLRRAERDRDQAQEGRERAEAALADVTAEAAAARRELGEERERRRALAAELAEAVDGRDRALEERARAVAELKAAEARQAERDQRLREMTADLEAAEAAVAEARNSASQATPIAPVTQPEPEPAPEPSPAGGDDLDRQALAASIEDAAAAATRLATSLAAAASVLAPGAEPSLGTGPDEAGAPPPERTRRQAARLPGGLFDDTPEAAEHLLGLPEVVVLVDGYNLAMRAWPDADLADQRERLVAAVGAVTSRRGAAEPVVVFDGADIGPSGGVPRAPGVQVRFSPEGVEADDVILDLAERYPARRPVVVVSDDRRVRDGARARGANVLGATQFLALR